RPAADVWGTPLWTPAVLRAGTGRTPPRATARSLSGSRWHSLGSGGAAAARWRSAPPAGYDRAPYGCQLHAQRGEHLPVPPPRLGRLGRCAAVRVRPQQYLPGVVVVRVEGCDAVFGRGDRLGDVAPGQFRGRERGRDLGGLPAVPFPRLHHP